MSIRKDLEIWVEVCRNIIYNQCRIRHRRSAVFESEFFIRRAGEDIPRPTPEARGSGREDQPHAVALRAQEGLEELSHIEGQEGRQ